MSETKWTAGPWSISKRNDPEAPYSIISGAASGLAYAVAMCPRYRGDDWGGDAYLISAAPELYEALQVAELVLRERGLRALGEYKQIESALTKARGEQP